MAILEVLWHPGAGIGYLFNTEWRLPLMDVAEVQETSSTFRSILCHLERAGSVID